MKIISWSDEKAKIILDDVSRGGITFNYCAEVISSKTVLAIVENPSSNHQNQKMFVIEYKNYAFCVPYVEKNDEIFLKTIYPSRRYTALFLKRSEHETN